MTGICDSFQRPIDYLRISVSDRCNLNCFYCVPEGPVLRLPHQDVLSYEEIETIVWACAELGITKIRLTGGEPLVRRGITGLVARIAQIPAVEDLSLTTNGVLLAQFAPELKRAGLKRVNVSLDSLRPERFRDITGGDRLRDVLQGIEEAKRVGLSPVKVNTVVLRGVNDDEVLDFARLTLDEGWHIRFIELMPFGQYDPSFFVSARQVKRRLRVLGKLEPVSSNMGSGPAKYFRLPGARGTIGFITPISEHFCFSCNRLRLTSDGKLKLCLLGNEEVDLKQLLRAGAAPQEMKEAIRQAVSLKPLRHHLAKGLRPEMSSMAHIGG